VAHTAVAKLNCGSVSFTSFHTLWPHKSGNRPSSLVHSVNGAPLLNVSQYYQYSKFNKIQLTGNEGRFVLFVSAIFVNTNKLFRQTEIAFTFLVLYLYPCSVVDAFLEYLVGSEIL
jgi:hypothetical protein